MKEQKRLDKVLCMTYNRLAKSKKEVRGMDKTNFYLSMDLSDVDEKLQQFVKLRNELVLLAEEIGVEVRAGILELAKK